MERIVYHGSSIYNLQQIQSYGFDLAKVGTGWGITYGDGIYFTPSKDIANQYSDNTGWVLEVVIKYKPYQLKNNYSPTDRNHKKKLRKLREKAIENNYTCFVNKNLDEIVLFDNKNTIKSRLIKI